MISIAQHSTHILTQVLELEILISSKLQLFLFSPFCLLFMSCQFSIITGDILWFQVCYILSTSVAGEPHLCNIALPKRVTETLQITNPWPKGSQKHFRSPTPAPKGHRNTSDHQPLAKRVTETLQITNPCPKGVTETLQITNP